MKNILLATAVFLGAASAASAFELGNGLSVGGEVEQSYDFGTEDFSLLFTPEVDFAYAGLALNVSTEFDVLELNNAAVDNFHGLDFEATYGVNDYITAFGEISTDKDFEFGDLVVGTRLNF